MSRPVIPIASLSRRLPKLGTEPTHWLERLCSAPDCLARKIAEGKP